MLADRLPYYSQGFGDAAHLGDCTPHGRNDRQVLDAWTRSTAENGRNHEIAGCVRHPGRTGRSVVARPVHAKGRVSHCSVRTGGARTSSCSTTR